MCWKKSWGYGVPAGTELINILDSASLIRLDTNCPIQGGPFGVGNRVLISSHRKLLSSIAMVVSVAETLGHDSGRHG